MLSDDEREMTEILSKSMGKGMLEEVKKVTDDAKRLGDARYALTHEKLDRIIETLKRLEESLA